MSVLEAGVGIEPTHRSFAGSCITTLLPSRKVKKNEAKNEERGNLKTNSNITRFMPNLIEAARYFLKIKLLDSNQIYQCQKLYIRSNSKTCRKKI